MFEQMAPGALDSPMVQMGKQMTMSELMQAAPQARPMFEAVLEALNQQEEF